MEDKKLLRKRFSEIRKNISEKDIKDSLIRKNFHNIGAWFFFHIDTILLYTSFGSEIDTWTLAEEILNKKIDYWYSEPTTDENMKTHSFKLAFPKCGKDGIMTFHIVKSLDELHKGMYGIYEPDNSLPQPEVNNRTLCVLPGLAFMKDGSRLGYGGGYYDRFLQKYPQIHKIALAYEELITDNLPVMPHDIRADYIVTPERMVLCHAEQRQQRHLSK